MTHPQELRALDALVHERVLGRETTKERAASADEDRGTDLRQQVQRFYDKETEEEVPHYSRDPETIERVEDRLEEDFGWSIEDEGEEDGHHLVRVFARNGGVTPIPGRGGTYEEALCQAAVDAVTG